MVVSHAFTRLATVVILLLGAVPLTADAQPHGKVYRIGYIQVAAPNEMEHLTKAFDEGLRELGYVEGRNIVFERRFAGGKQERLPDLAAELARLNVDVIVTGANPAIAAIKRATATIRSSKTERTSSSSRVSVKRMSTSLPTSWPSSKPESPKSIGER